MRKSAERLSNERKRDINKKLSILRARQGILAFTDYTKSDYQTNWHHHALAEKLNAFVRGEIRYLMVFMPPRHGKSELVSRRLPAFLHGLYPDSEIMAVSYLDSLAGDMTIDVQKIIESKEYQDVFPHTKIFAQGTAYSIGTRNSSEHHIVGRRGKYRGQGVGGSFTGKGANFIIIDDPIKGREIADSEAFRERLWNFYTNDLFTRLETDLGTGRRGQILITQTRWHEDDLSGRLIDRMKNVEGAVQWEILSYPAIREDLDTESDKREIGEALWPEKYDLKQLNEIKASTTPRGWSAVYQQNPVAGDGNMFVDHMFQFVDVPMVSKFDWTFITADTAYKEKEENDFTVFSYWGVAGEGLYLIDIWRRQMQSSLIEHTVEPWIKSKLNYGYRGTFIEPKGHGIYLNQVFAKKGLLIPSESDLDEFYNDRRFDKAERANNVIPHLANRKIFISNQIANKEALVAECLGFPRGRHDDFVDTLVDAMKKVYSRSISMFDVPIANRQGLGV